MLLRRMEPKCRILTSLLLPSQHLHVAVAISWCLEMQEKRRVASRASPPFAQLQAWGTFLWERDREGPFRQGMACNRLHTTSYELSSLLFDNRAHSSTEDPTSHVFLKAQHCGHPGHLPHCREAGSTQLWHVVAFDEAEDVDIVK